jgi:hypothetical protein
MDTTGTRGANREAEAALARVLHAEHEARVAIDAARAEAAHLAEAARSQARAIAERTRIRIVRGQAAAEQRLRAQLADVATAARALPAHGGPDATDDARLEAAVCTLAASLTGSAPEPR